MDATPKDAKCCAIPTTAWGYRPAPCGNRAKVERNGKFYCGIHDPVAVRAKRDARNAKWDAQREASERQYERHARIRAARDAVVSMAQLAARQHATWDDVARAVAALAFAERAPNA
jgi:uncharacterized Zn finger protein (UPF0148 family)